jgi:lincosamide nucleotidyltransferase A/C/D/E
MMTASDAADLYRAFNDAGIRVWVDGGWAVDALLGRQTRPHQDLDIAIEQCDVATLRELLAARGYSDVPRDDTSAWNFVLGDDQGRDVDVHVMIFDPGGNGRYGPAEKGMMYPAASLTGAGMIDGMAVKCISAESMVKFKTGYELSEKDFADVAALCERFGIEYPAEHRR